MFGIFFSSLMNHMKFIFFLFSTIYSIELIFQSKPPVFKISNLSPLSYMNCRKSRISSANVWFIIPRSAWCGSELLQISALKCWQGIDKCILLTGYFFLNVNYFFHGIDEFSLTSAHFAVYILFHFYLCILSHWSILSLSRTFFLKGIKSKKPAVKCHRTNNKATTHMHMQ